MSEASLFQKLEACKTLPTMPGVAVELMRVCRDENSDMAGIAATLSRDPALAAKVLATANSTVYKRRIEVKTLQQAAAMLGRNAVMTLGLSFSLVKNRGTASFNHAAFWKRSLFSAVSARSLARRISLDAEQLFLAGLIQDLGILAMATALPDYAQVTAPATDHDSLANLEAAAYGANHAEITAWLARRWRLPEFIADSALGSHAPSLDPTTTPAITRCVAASNWLAGIWVGESAAIATRDAATRASSWLGVDRGTFHDVIEEVVKDAPELARLLDIQIEQAETLVATAQSACAALAAVSFRQADSEKLKIAAGA